MQDAKHAKKEIAKLKNKIKKHQKRKDIITLEKGLKFVILDKFSFEREKYLYLSSYRTEKIK